MVKAGMLFYLKMLCTTHKISNSKIFTLKRSLCREWYGTRLKAGLLFHLKKLFKTEEIFIQSFLKLKARFMAGNVRKHGQKRANFFSFEKAL